MNIFISCSGNRSRIVAQGLHAMISSTFQIARVWMSVDDIHRDTSWRKIFEQFHATDIGIVCLTQDNIDNTWLAYEAGVLSARDLRLFLFLIDLSFADLTGPLTNFQGITTSKSDVRRLVEQINASLEQPLTDGMITRIFNVVWSEFEKILADLPPVKKASEKRTLTTVRSDRELLEEILENVRRPNENRLQTE